MEMELKQKEKELASFIGRLLREHFGKGPGSVYASIADPYITIYFTQFLSPMENKLLANKQSTYVQKIRDLLMKPLVEEIKAYIQLHTDIEIEDFYYDWDLETQSGMFAGFGSVRPNKDYLPFRNQEAVHDMIAKLTEEVQKLPGEIYSCVLNPRTLLVVRERIFIQLEKELIHMGFQENLRIAKRRLEKGMLLQNKEIFEKLIGTTIVNVYVDWNFKEDKSAILFILQPNEYRAAMG